jgi:DNA helicase-2/ATP-dependent DNA helicase PcrA
VNPLDPFNQDSLASARTDALAGLNATQREAVTHDAGPLLVLAGAGSGKTRVITHRIAHLIRERGVQPHRVVAVTFTNKAAAEMRDRVERLLGSRVLGAWIGTFHALCVRILRRDGERVGLAPGFNIYDGDDQLALVKRILKAEAGEEASLSPRTLLSRISRAKNALQSLDDLEQRAFTPERKLLVCIFREYQEALRKSNAVDFDDLLLRAIELFREHADVAQAYAERCEHLLVDEYQDTNRPQYLLVRALTARHGNVCVVGDEDQSIYRFRGAELRNILEFENDHPGTRTIRLEQNYRSTGTILRAAGAVVANNVNRKGKTLWTENPPGDKIECFRSPDDRTEAAWIAQRVGGLAHDTDHGDIAVLYRTNAQSRLFEEIFRREGIPFQVVGSVRFYARKEVKDVLAYLRLAANRSDDVAFRRVVNTPPRGIGATTLGALERVAATTGLPLLDAVGHVLERDLIATRSAKRLVEFRELVDGLAHDVGDEPIAVLLERVVAATSYEAYLEKAYPGMGADRMENVQSLVSAAVEYAEESDDATLEGFLDRSALVSDADDVGREPGVTLMTVHCAKGLEFPVVFLSGLEERLFPHAMSVGSDEDIEEERRLCYVAMTRAKQRLLMTHARFRRIQGVLIPNPASRFIGEIPAEVIEEIAPPAGYSLGEPTASASGSRDAYGSSAARVARRRREPPPPVPPRAASLEPCEDGYDIGAHVTHPRFGGGRILDREGKGKNLKLTIDFREHGRKKILPSYTRLEVGSP